VENLFISYLLILVHKQGWKLVKLLTIISKISYFLKEHQKWLCCAFESSF
jgi:hypothetical protein